MDEDQTPGQSPVLFPGALDNPAGGPAAAVPGALGWMIEILQGHRAALEEMHVTACDIAQDRLPAGLRLTLRIYVQILADGLSVLNSIISYLEKDQTVHG